jgi:alpha/beta superfamily hydrolase
MQNGVVVAICEAVAARGMAALRFNFRGVGDSQGSFGDGVGERSDAAAALDRLKALQEVLPDRIGIVGYSFGAAVALFAADSTVRAVVAVSTPTIARDASEIDVRCPALFVVGGRDQSATVDCISRLGPSVGPEAKLAEVPAADHFWTGLEGELAIIVSSFLADVLMDAAAQD